MESDDLQKTPERRFSRRINSRDSTNADCSSVENTPNVRRSLLTKKKETHPGKIGYFL